MIPYVLVFSDLHCHHVSPWLSTEDLFNQQEKTFNWLLERFHGISHAIFLGDLFERSNPIDTRLSNLVHDFFDALAHKVALHVVVGNHDFFDHNGSLYYPAPYLKLYRRNTTNLAGVELHMAYVPYGEDPHRLDKATQTIFSHTPIKGYKLDHGVVEKTGTDMVALGSTLPNLTRVFHGHYHRPEEWTSGNIRGLCIGQTSPRTFHESEPVFDFLGANSYSRAGAVLLDNNLEWERIPNPHKTCFVTFREGEMPIHSLKDIFLVASQRRQFFDKLYLQITCKESSRKEFEQETWPDFVNVVFRTVPDSQAKIVSAPSVKSLPRSVLLNQHLERTTLPAGLQMTEVATEAQAVLKEASAA